MSSTSPSSRPIVGRAVATMVWSSAASSIATMMPPMMARISRWLSGPGARRRRSNTPLAVLPAMTLDDGPVHPHLNSRVQFGRGNVDNPDQPDFRGTAGADRRGGGAAVRGGALCRGAYGRHRGRGVGREADPLPLFPAQGAAVRRGPRADPDAASDRDRGHPGRAGARGAAASPDDRPDPDPGRPARPGDPGLRDGKLAIGGRQPAGSAAGLPQPSRRDRQHRRRRRSRRRFRAGRSGPGGARDSRFGADGGPRPDRRSRAIRCRRRPLHQRFAGGRGAVPPSRAGGDLRSLRMKRLTALVLFLAAVAGLAYWVHTHHNGNLYAAWSQTAAAVRSLAGGQTREAANPNSAPTPAAGARQGRGRNPGEAPRVAVVTAVAESVDLPITRSSVGWVEPDATVTVRARIDGQVVEQKVRDGDVVKAGDVLFRIDDREIQAQIARDEAMLAKDQATLARTQADVRRVEELLSKGSASRQQFDVVTADSKVAAANVAADQATLQADRIKLDYTVIKAPIAGRVGVVRVTPGNLVRANDTGDGLVTITQLKPLRISFSLPERELDLVRAALARNGAAPVRAYASGATQASATGKLFFVDSAVDTLSGTVTAKAMFDNEGDQLWPGQYVRIEVDLGVRPNVITVPLVAVSPGQGGSFAFVVKADGTVERRKVEIADSRNEIAVIASGIRPGEKVVIEGQARLSDGSPVVEKPAPGGPAAGGTDRTAQAQ